MNTIRRILVSMKLMEEYRADFDRIRGEFPNLQIDKEPTSRPENFDAPFYEGTFEERPKA